MKIMLRNGKQQALGIDKAIEVIANASYVNWYDALPSGKSNELGLLDLAFPAYLGAVPKFKTVLVANERANVLTALEAASRILRKVPKNTTLSEWADTDEHRALLGDLFVSTTGGYHRALPGFGPATCTKMLHKKRPALIPIIDSWQLQAWGKRSASWRTRDMVDVVFEIRGKALIPQAEELAALGNKLETGSSKLPHLSAVRLYDILFWELSNNLSG